jgi:aryl-alcohol dehydrogenase-like predicted oxidoreductase
MRWEKPYFQPENLSRNLCVVDLLRPLAADQGKSLAQLAIAWVLQHPAVSVALVGARKPSQIEETVGGAGWSLAGDEMAHIEEILATTT